MAGTWSVARRELLSLWVTPLAWSLMIAFCLINGSAFVATLNSLSSFLAGGIDIGPIQAFYGQSIFVPLGYLLLCPLLTMRSLAEERRSGTAELLLGSPLSATQIVVGKYFALALTYVAMWLPTLAYPIILRDTGSVEWPVVFSSYVGVLGLGLSFISIGVLASAVTPNQLVAALLTGTLIFAFILCELGKLNDPGGLLSELFDQLSIASHLADFALGVVRLRRIVYVVSLTILPLFLAVRAVEAWRDG